MLTVRSWWLLSGKKVAYYFLAVFFFVIVALGLGNAEAIPGFIKATVAFLTLGFSCYLWRLASNIAEPRQKEEFSPRAQGGFQRVINLDSGTYNESVQVHGDFVQGDKNIFNNFNFNQDVSGAIKELETLLKRLENQLGNPENVQQEAIQELSVLAHRNFKIREILYGWLKALDITSPTDEIEAAEKLISAVYGLHHHSSRQSIFQLDKRFRRLEYLLKTAQWHEADDETVRVIAKLMPARSKHRCTRIDVSQIPPRALRTINRLWLEASAGRFGFSVQKRIWQRIKTYQHQKSRLQKSEREIFVEAVGWSNEAGRIYYVDLDYLITNPKGHLPMKVLLWETYDPSSNYCYLSHCLFDEFMKREYSNVSFLPDWLREWLLLD